MEMIMTEELKNAIHKVGELIRNDPRYAEMVRTSAEYTNNVNINKQLDEYSALQATLSSEYEKQDFDESVVKPIQTRMNELYTSVINDPAYVNFKEASEAYTELTDAVYAELEYSVTGNRRAECTHDCSTCHGCD